MADDNVRSIQGEQQPPDEDLVYVTLQGPNVQVPRSKLAPYKGTQRLVVDVHHGGFRGGQRTDGEDRETRVMKVVEVVEYGVITEPEELDDAPTLFDDASEG